VAEEAGWYRRHQIRWIRLDICIGKGSALRFGDHGLDMVSVSSRKVPEVACPVETVVICKRHMQATSGDATHITCCARSVSLLDSPCPRMSIIDPLVMLGCSSGSPGLHRATYALQMRAVPQRQPAPFKPCDIHCSAEYCYVRRYANTCFSLASLHTRLRKCLRRRHFVLRGNRASRSRMSTS
jgi:hypothetical protein